MGQNTNPGVPQRGLREDEIAIALRAHAAGVEVETLVADAEKLRAFMETPERAARPDWADVAQFADITAERDRARDTAARLEQELAEKERELDETRQHLIKGTLQHALALARTDTTRSGIRVVQLTAEKFGVEL